MTNDERAAKLSDLHMIVLGRIAHLASADVDDIAGWLGGAGRGARGRVRRPGSRRACDARHRTLKVRLGT
jgi:hypothetical protein